MPCVQVPNAKEYILKPPRVAYTKTASLRDILVRSKVPPSKNRQGRRQVNMGLKKCGGSYCTTCSQSYTCNYTGDSYSINSIITCTRPGVIYSVACKKNSGECLKVKGPQYMGCTDSPLVRFSEHLGSVTQPSQPNTAKPLGVHFSSAGQTQANMVVQPIEKVRSKDRFILEARDRFWIGRYSSVKIQTVEVVEDDLNLK